MSFTGDTTIPIVDLAGLINNYPEGEIAASEAIYQACTVHGFFYVKNHGVSENLQSELEHWSKAFFELPEYEKMKISMDKAGKAWRGFFPVGNELTSGKPDQKEGIYFGQDLEKSHPKVLAGTPLHGANLFPEKPRELATVVTEYMASLTALGKTIMKGVAMSLSLPSNYFERVIGNDPFILFRIFHYPPSQTPDTWGVGEHTDYGLLTILKQDTVGGLQVKSRGKWIEAPPIPNTFICNIGDMLDRMTGGLYLSTPHRVRNVSERSRLSFPLFFDPNFDTVVKPIGGLPSSNHSVERWDNKTPYDFNGTYGEYLTQKVAKVFPQLMRKT